MQLLVKPFPQEESFSETLGIITAISVFVFLFLYVFQPFGIHQVESGLLLLCLGFGAVTFFASLIYEFLVINVFKMKGEGVKFTYGRWVLYFLGAMFVISLGNFLFVRLAIFGHIEWHLFPYMMRGTLAVGFFPIVVIGAIALLRQERKNQHIADAYNQGKGLPMKSKEAEDQVIFDILSSRIHYIEGMQNYIKLGHIDAEGLFKEHTERATLKSISDETRGTSISRCHRSFFVNKKFIASISGNAQGLLLSLLNCEKIIPVSRSYISEFKDS